jgi:hypothetical protein
MIFFFKRVSFYKQVGGIKEKVLGAHKIFTYKELPYS